MSDRNDLAIARDRIAHLQAEVAHWVGVADDALHEWHRCEDALRQIAELEYMHGRRMPRKIALAALAKPGEE